MLGCCRPTAQGGDGKSYAGGGGDQAEHGETAGQNGKPLGKEAKEHKENNGFGALGEAAEVVDALAGIAVVREPVAFGEDGEGEKAAAGAEEGKEQEAGGGAVGQRIGQGKAKHHHPVKEKVEDDIEKGAAVAWGGEAGDQAVEAVAEAVEGDGQERRAIEVVPEQQGDGHADGKAHPADGIGADLLAVAKPRASAEEALRISEGEAIEHRQGMEMGRFLTRYPFPGAVARFSARWRLPETSGPTGLKMVAGNGASG